MIATNEQKFNGKLNQRLDAAGWAAVILCVIVIPLYSYWRIYSASFRNIMVAQILARPGTKRFSTVSKAIDRVNWMQSMLCMSHVDLCPSKGLMGLQAGDR